MDVKPGAVQLSFEVMGVQRVGRRIDGVLGRTEDLTPALEKIRDDFYALMGRAFDTEGKSTGGEWEKLDEKYARWKAKHYPGMKILQRTGRLRGSLTAQAAPGSIYELTRQELVIGSAVRTPKGNWNLGALHHTGAGKLPKRPIIRLDKATRRYWVRLMREHVRTER